MRTLFSICARKCSAASLRIGDYDLRQVEGLAVSSVYVGYERISGFVSRKRGTFVVLHEGEIVKGVSRSKWQVVESSGTDELRHVQGQGTFRCRATQEREGARTAFLPYLSICLTIEIWRIGVFSCVGFICLANA